MIHHKVVAETPYSEKFLLSELMRGFAVVDKNNDCQISNLQMSSQNVEPGDLFIALPGLTADGRDYIDQARKNCASSVVFESQGTDRMSSVDGGVSIIGVDNLKEKLGAIASRFFGEPSKSMQVIGITGTNGKTTTAYMITQALEIYDMRCGYSGTIGSGAINSLTSSELTTMDVVSIHQKLHDFHANQFDAVCMEVSSHGLDQGRVNGVDFDVAIFTNLSQDHLDYHQSMAAYGAAKKKLFEFPSLKSVVVNQDDVFGQQLINFLDQQNDLRCISYGVESGDLQPTNLEVDDVGICFDLNYENQTYSIESKLIGELNVPNILATIGGLLGVGLDMSEVVPLIFQLAPPPGRMEVFRNNPDQPVVIVDYAHTPDALERTLVSLRSLCKGKLIVVFGCGGDRDQGKRQQMGEIADAIADRIILTDDNPRTEPPAEIIEQIKSGISRSVAVQHDRKQALRDAIKSAGSNDLILLAGKGHESTQTIGVTQYELSDRKFTPEILEALA